MPTFQPGQIIGGKYRITKKIGEGGMGAVYVAENVVQGGRAALKVLTTDIHAHPELFIRFQNEARAANEAGHPGIVPVYDSGQLEDGTPWLVMPFLTGESLSARMAKALRNPQHAIGMDGLWIIGDIASALAAAHDRAIIHRDLKPANVMLVADSSTISGERAMVLDFGIAKLTNDELTKKGAILGTPVYMPLEQFKDSGLVDGRADVFSLGVVAYQLLSGRLPHTGATQYEVMGQRLMEPIRSLGKLVPSLPGPVVELVMAMLEKEPAARPSMLFVEGAIRRAQGLPPIRQSGFRAAVVPGPKTPETVDGPASYGDTNQPTPDLPAYRTQDVSSGFLQAVGSAAAGTPSEQRAVGELSPPWAVPIPVNVPETLSNMPSVPMPVAPWKSSPDDSTTAPPPSLIPMALASPSSPTTADPALKQRWYRIGAGLAAVAAVTTALILELPRRRSSPNQPPVEQSPPTVVTTPPALTPTPPQPDQQPQAAGLPPPSSESPDLGAPPSPHIAAKAETAHRSLRKPPSRNCGPQEVTVSCIVTPGLTMPQRQSIVSALQHGNIRLCSTERMILTGVPNHPHVKIAPSSLHHEQTVLLYGLRALTGQYPAEIEVRCRAK